jgi:hypothetical protein
VEEMKEEVTTDWPGTGSVLAQHPGLVAELAGIDARLEELAGQEATTREPGQGEQEAQPVEQVEWRMRKGRTTAEPSGTWQQCGHRSPRYAM